MAEEIKTETSEVEKKEDAPTEEGTEGAGSGEPSKDDFEAQLKAERERGKKEGFAEAEFKRREKERKDDEPEEKPLTRKELDDLLKRQKEETLRAVQSDVIAAHARRIAKSDAESELIIEVHKNRVFPENMTLDEQLDEARAIAHSKASMKARLDEIKRAEQSKETASADSASTHRESQPVDEPSVASDDIKAIKAAGYKWDGATRKYVAELPGGRKLVYDPKTKKSTRV